ncbi:MAG: hypothetical protein L0241_24670 [Planctomycetia bacterium]|nr:hypothetical protein [Planctomycetia bacterium]
MSRLSCLLLVAGFFGFGLVRADEKPVVVKLAKLSATAPADWKNEKPANRLRTYQFKLPGAKDHPAAELAIYNESRPGTEKTFPGWKATFIPPEGKTIDEISKTYKWEVPGATVNVLDITGTWKYKERPLDKKEKLLDDWRVIWVIIEEKDAKGELIEAHHFRLSGPSVTVDAHAKAFEKWVKSLK